MENESLTHSGNIKRNLLTIFAGLSCFMLVILPIGFFATTDIECAARPNTRWPLTGVRIQLIAGRINLIGECGMPQPGRWAERCLAFDGRFLWEPIDRTQLHRSWSAFKFDRPPELAIVTIPIWSGAILCVVMPTISILRRRKRAVRGFAVHTKIPAADDSHAVKIECIEIS